MQIAHVHATCHPGQVLGLAVGIRVLLCTIIAVAVGVLHGAIKGEFVLVFFPEEVVADAAAVDDMACLLGDVSLVGLQVELIPPTAQLVGGMVFQVDAAEVGGSIVRPKAESIHVELAQFRESVAIAVVGVTVAVGLIECNAVGVVFCHQRDIAVHHLLPAPFIRSGERRAKLEGVVDGVFGDDVDCTSNGIGAEEGRPTSAHHLYAFNHVGGYLLQSIHPAQGADDWTAIDKDLRVGPIQAIDANLRKAAVLAVVLHAQSTLKVERLGQVGGVDHLEEFGAHYVDYYRCIASLHFVAVSRDHYLVGHIALLLQLEVEQCGVLGIDLYALLLRFVANGRYT